MINFEWNAHLESTIAAPLVAGIKTRGAWALAMRPFASPSDPTAETLGGRFRCVCGAVSTDEGASRGAVYG